jgi:hypothetical protein
MNSKGRELAKNLLVFLLLAVVTGYLARRFEVLKKGTDFVHLYTAARMVREGAGHQLYDLPVQEQFQARYGGRIGTYFNHPPFETLLYLPFALLPLSRAYLLWSALNLILLTLVARLMERYILQDWSWRFLLMSFLLFPPVLFSFLLGQDSILLLFFFACTFAALREEKDFTAGCFLACGLFKFQLAIPAALVLLSNRGKRFLAGFMAVAVLLVGVSVAICGRSVLVLYPQMLMQLGRMPLAGIHPKEQMANLRGLAALLSLPPGIGLGLTIAASLLVLALALRDSHRNLEGAKTADLIFAQAVVAACLLSYHLLPHDLSLLLLPMALTLRHLQATGAMLRSRHAPLMLTGIMMFFPPLHLFLLRRHSYAYLSVLVLLLFLATAAELRTRSPVSLQNL